MLNHTTAVITIDYALNDRGLGEEAAKAAWESMIEQSLSRGIKVILLTPNWANSYYVKDESRYKLESHTKQVRMLAEKYEVGLVDTFKLYENYVKNEWDLVSLISCYHHPSAIGHRMIAEAIAKFFYGMKQFLLKQERKL